MAAALRVQNGPDWISHVWKSLFSFVGEVLETGSNRRKRRHHFDHSRKVSVKYKKQRLLCKSKPVQCDVTYGENPVELDVSSDELKRLSSEYLARLSVTKQQQQSIANRTSTQANDPTGEWRRQRHGRLTASTFGEICKRQADYGPLTIQLLYKRPRETAEMRYGIVHEQDARHKYLEHLQSHSHPEASVNMTEIHIDLKVSNVITIGNYIYIALLLFRIAGLVHRQMG